MLLVLLALIPALFFILRTQNLFLLGAGAIMALLLAWVICNGKYDPATGSNDDSGEKHKAGEELRELHSFLNSIVENIPDMIFVKDAEELRFVRFNKAGEELLGYKREDLIGKSDRDFFPAEEVDFFMAKDRAVLEGKKLLDIPEESIHTKNGVAILHTKKIPLLDPSGKPQYLLGISEDITERKKAENALARTTEELCRSNSELEQFAYVVSHDLQEPLRMVSGYTQLLQKRYDDKLDDAAREFIHYAVDGAQRMHALINDLLVYSKVGTHGRPFEKVACEEALQKALLNLKVAIEESNNVITHDPLPVLIADPVQITQLLQNLVGNAIKFRGEKPCRIHLSAEPREDEWLFSIQDNGIGIDPQYHERIFQIFQRLHTREKYPGTGIGLALCKRIVERHGGRIWPETGTDGGTVFYFTIPIEKEYSV